MIKNIAKILILALMSLSFNKQVMASNCVGECVNKELSIETLIASVVDRAKVISKIENQVQKNRNLIVEFSEAKKAIPCLKKTGVGLQHSYKRFDDYMFFVDGAAVSHKNKHFLYDARFEANVNSLSEGHYQKNAEETSIHRIYITPEGDIGYAVIIKDLSEKLIAVNYTVSKCKIHKEVSRPEMGLNNFEQNALYHVESGKGANGFTVNESGRKLLFIKTAYYFNQVISNVWWEYRDQELNPFENHFHFLSVENTFDVWDRYLVIGDKDEYKMNGLLHIDFNKEYDFRRQVIIHILSNYKRRNLTKDDVLLRMTPLFRVDPHLEYFINTTYK
jgi:hypothetical protein